MDFRLFVEPQQGFSYDEQLAAALAAERSGFSGFFRSDHYLKMGDAGDGLPGPTDAWTTLAGLARETTSIRLGTLVSSVTYRHPGILAIQVAQVDQMSGGRVELGLGTGWFREEHEAYGIPFPEKRFGLLEEQLAIVEGLWLTPAGETFSFAGEHYSLENAPALPKPVQHPLPVIVGGGGPKRTPAIAARFASEFNIGFIPAAEIIEKFSIVDAACLAIDRDPATLVHSVAMPTTIGRSDGEYRSRLETIHQSADTYPDHHIHGSPAQAIDSIGALIDAGAERIYIQVMDLRDVDHIELIGSEVLPAFT